MLTDPGRYQLREKKREFIFPTHGPLVLTSVMPPEVPFVKWQGGVVMTHAEYENRIVPA